VDVPGLMRSSSWNLELEVSLVRDAVSHLLASAAAGPPAGSGAAGPQPAQSQALGPHHHHHHQQQQSAGSAGRQQLQQQQQLQLQQQQQLQLQQQPAMAAGGMEGLGRAYIGEVQVGKRLGRGWEGVRELSATTGGWWGCNGLRFVS
jgi:hypothetical protein